MTFEVIFSQILDFQIFCSAVIPSEESTLDALGALTRHKSFNGKTKMSKIERKKRGLDRLTFWKSNNVIRFDIFVQNEF